jgi:hypothetical protein
VAFFAANIAFNEQQKGRNIKIRVDGSTWYVDIDVSGSEYEIQIIDFIGNTRGNAFRKDKSGKLLLLAEILDDPSKAHLEMPFDSEFRTLLKKGIQAESISMASFSLNGINQISDSAD